MFVTAQPLLLSLEFQTMARIVFFNLQMGKLRLRNTREIGPREIAVELPGADQAVRDLELIQ